MKKIRNKIIAIFSIFILSVILIGCTNRDNEIVIGQGDWDSVTFHDEVVKFIIEEGYDTNVRIVPADTAILVTSLISGDVDLTTELWTDNIATYEDDIANGHYKSLSTNFDDNQQGLYVPTYLVEGSDVLAPNLKTVEDLKDYAHLFEDPEGGDKGILYGGPEGWSATKFLKNKFTEYGLDEHYTFKTIDSNATLSATLASAYEKQEPWVGYNWEPTWIMGIYDMTLLEDSPYSEENFEKGIGSFPTVDVTVAVTKGFEKRFPEITEFLSNYETSSVITSDALGYMQKNDVEAKETAIWFLKNNQDLWTNWLPEDIAEKVLNALG